MKSHMARRLDHYDHSIARIGKVQVLHGERLGLADFQQNSPHRVPPKPTFLRRLWTWLKHGH